MRVKLVSRHGLKTAQFFYENEGKVFEVIQKRDGGYDVDMTPAGHPGKWGFLDDEEVEFVMERAGRSCCESYSVLGCRPLPTGQWRVDVSFRRRWPFIPSLTNHYPMERVK